MAHNSTYAEKPATVPFNILNLRYAVLRNFLDLMPLKDVYVLRDCNTVESLSRFRGVVVKALNVKTDTLKKDHYNGFISFSRVMNRRFNTTPLQCLGVHLGPDIRPDILLSRMEGQYYCQLSLKGNYHWKAVLAFLHNGIKYVYMHGNMDLPAEDIEDFINTLICYKVKKVCFHTKNYKPSWLVVTEKVCNKSVNITVKTVLNIEGFYPEIVAVTNDNAAIVFVGNVLNNDDMNLFNDEEM